MHGTTQPRIGHLLTHIENHNCNYITPEYYEVVVSAGLIKG